MSDGALGKVYKDGEILFREGDIGDCMYVVQEGQLEVVTARPGRGESRLRVLGQGDIFGEMAIFERQVRSATVRALGTARVLTVDKKTFLRRVQEDPTLAFNLVRMMSQRIRELSDRVVDLPNGMEGRAGESRAGLSDGRVA